YVNPSAFFVRLGWWTIGFLIEVIFAPPAHSGSALQLRWVAVTRFRAWRQRLARGSRSSSPPFAGSCRLLQAPVDGADDVARGEGEAAVSEDRHQARRVDPALVHQEHLQLRVAVLLDDEAALVRLEELDDLGAEGEAADAHEVDLLAAAAQHLE